MEDLIESCAVEGTMTLRGITPAMMTSWELAHPGVRENESVKYQYDATTQRLIVQCGVSPVHDSLQIFFQNCVFDSVQPRLGRAKFNRIVQVSTGSCEYPHPHPPLIHICAGVYWCAAYGAFTGDCNTASVKQPDAYVHVKGYDFPTVVCEAGFAEKMDDLMSDARLWLMHTSGQTTVVIVVAFVEVTDIPVAAEEENEAEVEAPEAEVGIPAELSQREDTVRTSDAETTDDEPPNPISDEPGASSSPVSSVLSSVATSDEDDIAELTEESILLASINRQTEHRKLAADLLDLHLRTRLVKPLLGRIDATVHLFRLNATHTDIEQTFTAVLLPVPQDSATQSFTLTMGDLLARAADAEGIDPAEAVVFPLDELRDVVEEQIPKMEKMRSMARARAEMKRVDVWEETETFAQMKRGRKRKVREDDDAEVGS